MTTDRKYRRLAVIGHGGMADVHLVVARGVGDFHKLLVLKELRPGFAGSAEHRAMFLHEARIAARMAHENVVQTYAIDDTGGRPCMTMEFLDGQPLHRVLRRLAPAGLPLNLHLWVLAEVLAGLHHAHELCDYEGRPLGLVHRDATPHNVVVTYAGQVKLVDFGIAHAAEDDGSTAVGTFKGKASYAAPEQARGDSVDRRTDLFAVGVMLWEALARRRMWPGLGEVAIVQRLREAELPALPEEAPCGPELRTLCERALAPELAGRPATAAEFAEALTRHIPGPRPSSRELGLLVSQAFTSEREALRRLIAVQLRGAPTIDADDAPVLDLALFTGSSSHVDAAHHPDEPTRPDGLPSGADPRAMRDETTLDPSRRRQQQRRRAYLTLILAACALVALTALALIEPPPQPGAQLQIDRSAPPPDCTRANKPEVELSGEIEGAARLTCDKQYRLSFMTFVRPGATLTIDAGTTIVGDRDSLGVLVVQPGARIVAEGTPDRPIVFTSAAPPHERRAGDWGGLLLLGRAPTNLRDAGGRPMRGKVEGIASGGEYGGDDPDDSSGVLRHVRVEYSGTLLGPNNEINGVTLAGVGRGTEFDHVQVRHTGDDCFEFFGGTVDAHHLLCQDPGDDGFDWDLGYSGRLQFLLMRGGGSTEDSAHGLEGDNDPGGSDHVPVSAPQIYNATLCGRGRPLVREHLGVVVRHGSRATLGNLIVAGFDAAIDLRDPGTSLALRGALGFALPAGVAQAEAPRGPLPDDDGGLDEAAQFAAAMTIRDPGIPGCMDPSSAILGPSTAITASAVRPPSDGFFAEHAVYLGAVRDAADTWATAPWTRWD
ncbi:MAG: serine/threonine protein kinase [Nannocystis sp.]|nr:serine/threonine-protein kinase [Nannocystis sp.]MBA3547858.1 serine/threonine protein kinase [Nannocystis sp.]